MIKITIALIIAFLVVSLIIFAVTPFKCSDFQTEGQANRHLFFHINLDRDNDGAACEHLPKSSITE